MVAYCTTEEVTDLTKTKRGFLEESIQYLLDTLDTLSTWRVAQFGWKDEKAPISDRWLIKHAGTLKVNGDCQFTAREHLAAHLMSPIEHCEQSIISWWSLVQPVHDL